MRRRTVFGMAFLVVFSIPTFAKAPPNLSLPRVLANDNRRPAGKLENGILELRLVLREGVWYPEDQNGGHREVYGFAEEGQAPQSAGPLIRVPQGTRIHLHVRNDLPLAARIYGLHRHPGDPEDGVYGALIVLEPGQTYDPEHDKTFVIGTGQYAPFPEMLLVNGVPEPEPMELQSGTRYRLRFINITTNESDLRVDLESKEVPEEWTVIAKDGANLPGAQRKPSRAAMGVTVGSTCDVEYQSELHIFARGFEGLIMQPLDFVAP
jgi:FtsP/CotA-like multicopper oxidase with cupredoxin domain